MYSTKRVLKNSNVTRSCPCAGLVPRSPTLDACNTATHAAAAMPLPDPTGPHRVGVLEADVPAPTDVGVVPVVIYYPAVEEPDVPPTALCGATSVAPQRLRWLDATYAAALGRSHLTGTLGAWSAATLMGNLGPAATNYEVVRADVEAQAQTPPPGGWPVAVFSHSLTGWRHVNSSLCAELASHGAVVVHLEHVDGTACLCTSSKDGRVLSECVLESEPSSPFASPARAESVAGTARCR